MNNKQSGFNLIEVLVVVVIVTILASLAIPNYRQSVQRSNRTDAKSAILTVAAEQEKFFMQNNRYTGDFAELNTANLSQEGYYNLALGPGATGNIASSFTVTATPVPGERQNDDGPCQTFTLSDQNIRGSAPDGPDVCWR